MKQLLTLASILAIGATSAFTQEPPRATPATTAPVDTMNRQPPPIITDSIQPSVAPEIRFAEGALTGAVVGVVLTAQNASCSPSSSRLRSGLIVGLWGGLRAMFGAPDRREHRAPALTDTRQPGPFPMDQDECGDLSHPSPKEPVGSDSN
jgi:hypothetical protein